MLDPMYRRFLGSRTDLFRSKHFSKLKNLARYGKSMKHDNTWVPLKFLQGCIRWRECLVNIRSKEHYRTSVKLCIHWKLKNVISKRMECKFSHQNDGRADFISVFFVIFTISYVYSDQFPRKIRNDTFIKYVDRELG